MKQRLWDQQGWVVLTLGKLLTSEPQVFQLKMGIKQVLHCSIMLRQFYTEPGTALRPPFLLSGIGSWGAVGGIIHPCEMQAVSAAPGHSECFGPQDSGLPASCCAGPSKFMDPSLSMAHSEPASPHGAGQAIHANNSFNVLIPNTSQLKKSVTIKLKRQISSVNYFC